MQQGLLSAFNPSDAYSQNLRQPVQGDMTLGNLASYFMPISRNVMPYEDSPRLGAGDYNFDFPQLMKDAYSGINKFGQAFRGELSPQELQQLAFDTSMNVTGGSLLGSRVIPNAVPSGGILGMGVSKTPNQTGLLGKANQVAPDTGLLGKVDNVQPKSGVSEVVPPTDKADGIIAFHGSPYDFNKFSLKKINTGEGAQAFGHGLYFSGKEDIAKFYRDSVRGYRDLQGKFDYKYKGKDFYTSPAEAKTQEELGVARIIEHARQISKHPEEAKKQLIIGLSREADKAKKIDDEELQGLLGFSYSKELDAVKSIDTSDLVQSKGSMYQVKLNTITDDLLNYDKPLGQQSDNIKNILNKMKSEVNLDDARNLGFDPFDYGGNEKRAIEEAKKVLFGKDEDVVRFLNNWSAIRGEQASGEKLLAKYGAKGIVYKADQGVGARNVPETGKNNYVIFDDKIIDIMKKYGIVGAVGVTAMQGGEQSPEANLSL